MKTSVIALATSFALILGSASGAFAQDATNSSATDQEKCLVEQGAGATPPGESLASESGSGDTGSATDNPPAIDDQNPGGCPDIVNSDDDDSTN